MGWDTKGRVWSGGVPEQRRFVGERERSRQEGVGGGGDPVHVVVCLHKIIEDRDSSVFGFIGGFEEWRNWVLRKIDDTIKKGRDEPFRFLIP